MKTFKLLLFSLLFAISSHAGTCDGSLILPMGADYEDCVDGEPFIYNPSTTLTDDMSGFTYQGGNYYDLSDSFNPIDVTSQYSSPTLPPPNQSQTPQSQTSSFSSLSFDMSFYELVAMAILSALGIMWIIRRAIAIIGF
jgi:hypothetical protein